MADPNKINSQLNNLKDMDAADLVKILGDHKNSLIQVVLITVWLLIVMWMLNDHGANERLLRMQLTQGNEKIATIKDRDVAIQNLNSFKSSLPKRLNVSQLITLISDYAKACNVTINTLSPADKKDMGLYDAINITFSGESDNFKFMMLFLRKIERSSFPLKIYTWSAHVDDKEKVIFSMEISAVLIHI